MIEFRVGDVRKLLAELPAGSVDLIATSWPYLAQRSYLPADHPMKRYEIGQESTPAEFIQTLLEVTAEFRRVLAPHGSIATELGDGFSGSGGAGGDYNANGLREGQQKFSGSARKRAQHGVGDEYRPARTGRTVGWPLERSLVMAPELYRVALAYGVHPLTGEPSPAGLWRVRNVVVHGRIGAAVGALGDKWRPGCSYWAVACTGRRWFDLDAVRGPGSPNTHARTAAGVTSRPNTGKAANDAGRGGNFSTLNVLHDTDGAPPLDWFEDEGDQFERDLWTLPTSPYPGQHFATFSPELIRRFIVSMCPLRVCRKCGKPSVRLTGEPTYVQSRTGKTPAVLDTRDGVRVAPGVNGWNTRGMGDSSVRRQAETLGWSDCGHGSYCCASCGGLVPYDYALRRPRESARSQAKIRTQELLAESSQGAGGPTSVSPDVPDVRDQLSGSNPGRLVLHQKLLSEARPQGGTSEHADGEAGHPRTSGDEVWVRASVDACGLSGSPTERADDAAPRRDAGASRQAPGSEGNCPPPERREGGQPNREPGNRDSGATSGNGDLPSLRRDVPGQLEPWSCPACGGTELRYVADHWRPGLVLDPFGGSGTTGMVAAGNGRDCLMFDLDERCVDLARERIGLYLDELAHPQEVEAPVPSDEQEAMF